ncbi:hypothetical protein O6H91_Y228500 [Diphasiastrum complanatum]|nr:hypothetical protein O6H91_Y228500 [Diphasiastrum complanatum]
MEGSVPIWLGGLFDSYSNDLIGGRKGGNVLIPGTQHRLLGGQWSVGSKPYCRAAVFSSGGAHFFQDKPFIFCICRQRTSKRVFVVTFLVLSRCLGNGQPGKISKERSFFLSITGGRPIADIPSKIFQTQLQENFI